jgi:hypothetical protein
MLNRKVSNLAVTSVTIVSATLLAALGATGSPANSRPLYRRGQRASAELSVRSRRMRLMLRRKRNGG